MQLMRHHRRARARTLCSAGLIVLSLPVLLSGCGGSGPAKRAVASTLPPVLARAPASSTPTRTARRPNIVFVLTDDLSMDLLRFMPHVRAMQRHGLTFRDYFVTDSLCCPSRASIFTGRFPHNTHIFNNSAPDGGFRGFYSRGEQRHTFNIALQRAGYLTAMMGKYLNGYMQDARKHADGAAADVAGTYVPPGWSEWDVAGWGYPEFNYDLNVDGSIYRFGHRPADYLTGVLAHRGVQFIHAAARRHRPFFLELATFAPHRPYVPAPRDAHDFPGLKAPRPPNFNVLPSHAPLWLAFHHRLSKKDRHKINRVYRRRAQSVQAVDRMIGHVEQALRATGQATNTYIVFSSDNGLHTGEYRLMPGKLTAFDTDIHVPLVVTGPGVRPGTRTSKLAENIDLGETFAALARTRFRGDGRSLAPLLHGRAPRAWQNAVLIEHHSPPLTVTDPDFQQPASGQPTTYEAIRTHNYLYVEYADGEREFYDLRWDPFELHNLASLLTPRRRLELHRSLAAMERCRGTVHCWDALHVRPLPGPL